MLMLYDSESFVVLHMHPDLRLGTDAAGDTPETTPPLQLPRHGFEIVDKRCGKGVYLDGSWAEMFQKQIIAWQQNTPSAQEVEDTLERYAVLAQQPVLIH